MSKVQHITDLPAEHKFSICDPVSLNLIPATQDRPLKNITAWVKAREMLSVSIKEQHHAKQIHNNKQSRWAWRTPHLLICMCLLAKKHNLHFLFQQLHCEILYVARAFSAVLKVQCVRFCCIHVREYNTVVKNMFSESSPENIYSCFVFFIGLE